jgi:hypothetical protein
MLQDEGARCRMCQEPGLTREVLPEKMTRVNRVKYHDVI